MEDEDGEVLEIDLPRPPPPVEVIPHDRWLYLELKPLPRLSPPVSTVITTFIMKDYSTRFAKPSPGPCPDLEECVKEMIYIQRGDFHLGQHAIRFNFLVCPSGTVYEARGWTRRGNYPKKYNAFFNNSIYVGIVGDYSKEKPPESVQKALDNFLRMSVQDGLLRPKFLHINRANPFDKKKEVKNPTNYMSSIYM